jgi:hypothetical protein
MSRKYSPNAVGTRFGPATTLENAQRTRMSDSAAYFPVFRTDLTNGKSFEKWGVAHLASCSYKPCLSIVTKMLGRCRLPRTESENSPCYGRSGPESEHL